jgi:anaerobic C4-dicarboxylate transporter-like protein
MIWLELVVMVACIAMGARLGGIALGTVAGVGLLVFVFILGMPPGGPPGVVIGMIIAVITAVSTLEAAGGLDYLVTLAERIMRRRPRSITFVAPVITYLLVFASGTTHVIYALLPIIAEVARQEGVRPERPLSISVIAGFQGVRASPLSAATIAMLGFLAAKGVSLLQLMAITVPSTFLAVLIGAVSVARKGPELNADPEYLARLSDGALKSLDARPEPSERELSMARNSTRLFVAGVAAVVLIGIFPRLRPIYDLPSTPMIESDQVTMSAAIMIVMIAVSGLMTTLFGVPPERVLKGAMMRSGVTAIISIVGLSWLGSSFFEANRHVIVAFLSDLVRLYPWTFAIGLFVLSFLLFSAAAAVTILVPVGIALGLSASQLIVFYPAAAGNFFLPTYGTLIAAVSFDRTGTTKIGSYVLNHSFMLPGLVTLISSILIAWALAALM